MDIEVKELSNTRHHIDALSELLAEAVADGASMGFMHPLAHDCATAFWHGVLAEADAGHQFVFGAFDGAKLVGTVTLCPVKKQNQPHRADVVKLAVAVAHRRKGVARKLMDAVQSKALALGRTVLVLDTDSRSDACRFYRNEGWIIAGTIPEYALLPHGGMCDSTFFWKKLKPQRQ